MKIGIIGTGAIGANVARLATAAGIDVVLANSRGPATLTELVDELGPRAEAGTVADAAQSGPLVVVAVPPTSLTQLPASLLRGRAILDTSNYYPYRDGRIPELDAGGLTTAEYTQRLLPASRVVKTLSNILAHHIPLLARPAGAEDRTALPLAGDDASAKTEISHLLHRLGFDSVDVGQASEAWRFEPLTAAYTQIYLDGPLAADQDIFSAPAAPTSRDTLTAALRASTRVDLGHRTT